MGDQFEKWIQNSAPVVAVDETKKEIHLAVLKQRLRQRDQRHHKRMKQIRRSGVAAMALVFILVGGNVSELGSDGFELEISPSNLVPDAKNARIGFRKTKLGFPGSMPEEEVLDLTQQMEAEIGIPAEVISINVHGNVIWDILYEYEVKGEKKLVGGKAVDRPSKLTRAHFEFVKSELDLLTEMIGSGNLVPVSSRIESVDGYPFLIKEYHFQSEKYGLVVYGKGVFTH